MAKRKPAQVKNGSSSKPSLQSGPRGHARKMRNSGPAPLVSATDAKPHSFQAGGVLLPDELIKASNPVPSVRDRSLSISSSIGGVPLPNEHLVLETISVCKEDEVLLSEAENSEDEIARDYIENLENDIFDGSRALQSSFASAILETPEFQSQSRKLKLRKGKRNKATDDLIAEVHQLVNSLERLTPVENEFDVTDFERPSLQRRRKKGELPILASVSDPEIREKLTQAWAKDREKKKFRRQEREELRQSGMLGLSSPNENDLRLKYPQKMNLFDVKTELREFLNKDIETLSFPPIDPNARKTIHQLSYDLGLKSKSHGSGQSRYLVVTKTSKSHGFDEASFSRAEKKVRRTVFYRTDIGRQTLTQSQRSLGDTGAVRPKAGEVVGEGASELGKSTGTAKAKAMMEKMGWKSGEGLGSDLNKGIVEPIQHIVRYSRAGLG